MAGGQGVALGSVGAGALFLYAGISGQSALVALRGLIRGQRPAGIPAPGPAASAGTTAVPSGGSAQQALQQAAASHGWTGAQWQALASLEMGEAGFNPHIHNGQGSGAYGLAQALGHGTASTQGTEANEYGGYGLSDAQARAANSGDAGAQAAWM